MRNTLLALALTVVLVPACGRPTPMPTYTPYPTHTPYPTYTPAPSYTTAPTATNRVIVWTQIVVVTATLPSTPLGPPTATLTPSRTPNATQTAQAHLMERLTASRGDGLYLVGVDIAPGVWRSSGGSEGCYWSVTTRTGDIIDNYFGLSGGTAYIRESAFQVQFDDCGQWVYLGPP